MESYVYFLIAQGARKGAVRAEKAGTQTRDISLEGGWTGVLDAHFFVFPFNLVARVMNNFVRQL